MKHYWISQRTGEVQEVPPRFATHARHALELYPQHPAAVDAANLAINEHLKAGWVCVVGNTAWHWGPLKEKAKHALRAFFYDHHLYSLTCLDRSQRKPASHLFLEIGSEDDEWFYSQSDKEQEQYIEQHPNSKFAKNRKPSSQDESDTTINLKGKDDADKIGKLRKEAEKVGDEGDHTVRLSPDQAKDKLGDPLHRKMHRSYKEWVREQQEFFHGEGHKPGSQPRRSLGQAVKAKVKGIVKSLKAEVHEYGLAAHSLYSLAHGNKLDDHQKKAVKTVIVHAGLSAASLTATGGLAEGLVHCLPSLAQHFVEHVLLVRAGKTAVFAADEASDTPEDDGDAATKDAYVEHTIEKFGDYVAEGNIPTPEWKAAYEKSKPEEEPAEGKEAPATGVKDAPAKDRDKSAIRPVDEHTTEDPSFFAKSLDGLDTHSEFLSFLDGRKSVFAPSDTVSFDLDQD
jgi:hypothetical protein